jgi:hypothetical protein
LAAFLENSGLERLLADEMASAKASTLTWLHCGDAMRSRGKPGWGFVQPVG